MGHFLIGGIKLLIALQATYATVAGTVRNGETNEPLPRAPDNLKDCANMSRKTATGFQRC